jgi:phage terminase large subunit
MTTKEIYEDVELIDDPDYDDYGYESEIEVTDESRVTYIKKLEPIFHVVGAITQPEFYSYIKAYEIFLVKGGRGGGKSESVAQALINVSRVEKTRILCTREIQGSMKDSVKAILEYWIHEWGLDDEFIIRRDTIINKFTGTDFVFIGMKGSIQNNTLKSLKGFKYVWFEEAHSATLEALQKLDPTIRIDGRVLFFTYNSETEHDAIDEYFAGKSKVCRIHINYYENPFCPKVLVDMAHDCYRLSKDDYEHIWLGNPRPDDYSSIVLPYSMLVQCIDAHLEFGHHEGITIGGFDVAEGVTNLHDKNSLATRKGVNTDYIHNWRIQEVYQSVGIIHGKYNELGFEKLNFDANAVGVAAKSEFERKKNETAEGLPYITVPYKGQGKVMGDDKAFMKHGKRNTILNRDQFANLKAQQWWNIRLRAENTVRLRNGEKIDRPDYFWSISSGIPNVTDVLRQMAQATYEHNPSGKILINKTPGEVVKKNDAGKKVTLHSPNDADSIILSFADDCKKGLRAYKAKGKRAVMG